MWLDADDVVDKFQVEKIIELKKTMGHDIDVVTMEYQYHFDSEDNPVLTLTRERLLKKEKNYLWVDPIHEYIMMSGNILHSDITIHHKREGDSGDRNIKIYEQILGKGEMLSPRSTYYYARELMDWGKYSQAIEYFNKFLDQGSGWFEDNISACFNLSKCYNNLNMTNKLLPVLFKSFQYDIPRAEICCEIGYYYRNLSDFKKAIFWFELALTLTKNSHGFVLNDYWDYIPSIELCSCYSLIGDMEKAYHYHKLSRAKYFTTNSLLSSFIDERPDSDEFDIRIKRFISRGKSKSVLGNSKVYKFLKPSKNFRYLTLGDLPSLYYIEFRVVRVKITADTYECLITNLPEWAFPPSCLKEIYYMRWGVESVFRQLKYAVGMMNFHAKKAEYIKQEIFANLIVYNFSEIIASHTSISKKEQTQL